MAAQLASTDSQRKETAVCACVFVCLGVWGRGGGLLFREWVEGGMRLSDTKRQI